MSRSLAILAFPSFQHGRPTGRSAGAAIVPLVEHAAVDASMSFVEQLAELPLDAWLRVGRTMAERDDTAEYMTIRALLDTSIAHQRLDVIAWDVRDAVETAVFHATGRFPQLSRADRLAVAAAHDAAEGAALALLACGCLTPMALATLVAPFAHHIPITAPMPAP